MKKKIFTFISVFCFGCNCVAQVIDPSFGINGKLVLDGIKSGDAPAIVQPDGKIVITGATLDDADIVIVRLKKDGSFDSSFGINGKVILDLGGPFDRCEDLKLQGDGKIVIAGAGSIIRLNTNGGLDITFNNTGKVTLDIGSLNILIQSDGKIVGAGTAGAMITLARLNADGSLDTGFGTSGKATHPTLSALGPNDSSPISDVLEQSDHKIVIAGFANPDGTTLNIYVMRCNPNGSLDNSYAGVGHKFIPNTFFSYVALISDNNKVTITGSHFSTTDIVRLNEDGTPDGSFNGNGMLSLTTDGYFATPAAYQPDGKLLVGGTVRNQTVDFDLTRLNNDGSIDNSFNNTGRLNIDFNNSEDQANGVISLQDGQILITGSTNVNNIRLVSLTRILTKQFIFYRDNDGDGHGDDAVTVTNYFAPEGYVTDNTDCNDNSSLTYPGAIEICGNNIDDNCNGQVDEGCSTLPSISVDDIAVSESQGVAVITVTLLPPSASLAVKEKKKHNHKTVRIQYKTVDGTAVGGKKNSHAAIDYITQKGKINFRFGITTATIQVPVISDGTAEGNEYFDVILTAHGVKNAIITKSKGRVTITENSVTGAFTKANDNVSLRTQPPVKKTSTIFNVSVSPNPSNSSFRLHIISQEKENIYITIMDMLGRNIKQIKGTSSEVITFGEEFKSGVYIIEARQGTNRVTQKIIKQ